MVKAGRHAHKRHVNNEENSLLSLGIMSHNIVPRGPGAGEKGKSSHFLTCTQYFLDIVGMIWYNDIIEIGGRRMKYTGHLIQFFTFVEDGRGPPRGKPSKAFSFPRL